MYCWFRGFCWKIRFPKTFQLILVRYKWKPWDNFRHCFPAIRLAPRTLNFNEKIISLIYKVTLNAQNKKPTSSVNTVHDPISYTGNTTIILRSNRHFYIFQQNTLSWLCTYKIRLHSDVFKISVSIYELPDWTTRSMFFNLNK